MRPHNSKMKLRVYILIAVHVASIDDSGRRRNYEPVLVNMLERMPNKAMRTNLNTVL
jgi:hypothetical protein